MIVGMVHRTCILSLAISSMSVFHLTRSRSRFARSSCSLCQAQLARQCGSTHGVTAFTRVLSFQPFQFRLELGRLLLLLYKPLDNTVEALLGLQAMSRKYPSGAVSPHLSAQASPTTSRRRT